MLLLSQEINLRPKKMSKFLLSAEVDNKLYNWD